MALELPSLLQRYQLDSSQAVSGAHQGVGALSTLGGAFRSLRGVIEAAGVSLGAFQIGSFLKESVREASATQQSLKTVTALFGPSAKEIVDWGETNAASFGIAKGAALQYAQQLGTVLKGFGFVPKAAADMSLSLEKVAGDVAVFRHQDPSQVIGAFQAGLYGATRGLRQYGIDVSATSIKQTALSLGITSATKTWDAQTKAQVFYALIMRGTTAEVGAAAARQHDLAVESKVLSAEMSNLRDRIGTALLPIMSAFIGLVIRDAIPALEHFTTWIVNAGSWVWTKFAQPLEHAFNLVKVAIDGFIIGIAHPNVNLDPFGWVGHSIIGAGIVVRRTFDTIRSAFNALTRGFSSGAGGAFTSEWEHDFARVGAVVRTVVDDIRIAWSHVGPILQPVFDLIGKFLGTTAGKTAAAAAGFTILGVSLATVVSGPIYEGLVGLANILSFLTSAIALLPFAAGAWIVGIGLMVGAIVYFYKTSATFRDELHRLLSIFENDWVPKIKAAGVVLRDGFIGAVEKVGPPLARFGSALLRDILPALRAIGGFISRNIVPILVGFGVVLAAVVTPVVLSGLAALGGLFVSMGVTIAGLFSPLVLVIGGIAALAGGAVYAYQHFKSFRDIVGDTVSFVVNLGSSIVRAVVPAFRAVASYVLGSVIPALATMAVIIARDALPVLREIGSFIVDRIIPGLVRFAGGAVNLVVPALRAVAAFGVLLLAALRGVAQVLINDVVPAVVGFGRFVARDLLPPLYSLTHLLSTNLLPVLVALSAAFVAVEIAPFVTALVAGVGAAVASVSAFIEVVGGLAVAGEVGAAIALIVDPITLAIAAIIALGAAFAYAYSHFKGFRDEVNGLVEGLKPLAHISFTSLTDSLGQLTDFWKGHWDEIVTITRVAMRVIGAVLAVAKTLWDTFGKDILASLANAFSLVAGLVKGVLDVLLGTIGLFLDLLTGHWSKAWHDLGRIVHGVWEGITAEVRYGVKSMSIALDEAKGAVGLFGRALVAALDNSGKQSVRALNDGAKLGLKIFYLQFVDIPLNIAKAIPRGAASLFDVGRSFVASLLDGAKSALAATLSWFTALPSVVRSAVHDPRDLATVGRNFVASLWNGAKAAFADTLRWFGDLPSSVRGAVGDVRDLFVAVGGSIVAGLLSGVTSAFGAVTSWFAHLPGYILAGVGDVGKLLYRAGQDITRGLYEGLLFQLKVFIFTVAGIPILVVKALAGLSVLMVKVGAAAIGSILKGTAGAARHLYKWFADLPSNITAALGDASSWLVRVGSAAIFGMTHGAQVGWKGLAKWFADLPGNVIALLSGAGDWLVNVGSDAILGLLHGASTAFGAVASWLHALPGYIAGALSNAGTWLLQAGTNVILGLLHGASAGFAAVASWLHSLPARARAALGNTSTWLLQAGRAVIEGLENGMKAAWHSVTSWLGHVGHDIVGFIKNPLGIFSPSRVMHEVGINTMLGLQNGLQSGWTGVVGAVSKMDVSKVFPKTPIQIPTIEGPVAGPSPGSSRRRSSPGSTGSDNANSTRSPILDEETSALIRQAARLADLQTEQRGVANSSLAIQQSQVTLRQATDDYNTALATYHDKNAPAVIQAQIAMTQAQSDSAQTMQDGASATIEYAKDLATHNGTVALAGVAAQQFRDKLIALADQFPAMRGPILDYVHKYLGAIPPTKTTTMRVLTSAAVKNIATYLFGLKGIPPGKVTTADFSAVQAKLLAQGYSVVVNGIPPSKNTSVTVTGVDAAIHAMTTLKNTVLQLDPGFNLNILAGEQHGGSSHAFGGNVSAGNDILVGEQGPEIFRPKVPGSVLTAPETRRTLAAAAKPPTPNSVVHDSANAVASAASSLADKMHDIGSDIMDSLRSGLARGHSAVVAQVAKTVGAMIQAATGVVLPAPILKPPVASPPEGPRTPTTVTPRPNAPTVPTSLYPTIPKPPDTKALVAEARAAYARIVAVLAAAAKRDVRDQLPAGYLSTDEHRTVNSLVGVIKRVQAEIAKLQPAKPPSTIKRPETKPPTHPALKPVTHPTIPQSTSGGGGGGGSGGATSITANSLSITANTVAVIGKAIAQVFTTPVTAPAATQPTVSEQPPAPKQVLPRIPPRFPTGPPTATPISASVSVEAPALDTVAIKALSDNLANASRSTPTAPAAAAQGDTNVTYDVDVYPQEHSMTDRGLVQELRKAERHGTLHSQTGVPRRLTGGTR